MSVVVIRTNQLCVSCLYLPAEDLVSDDRISAIECNDLCSDCVRNPLVRVIDIDPPQEVKDRVTANSPWLKKHGQGVSFQLIDPNLARIP